MDNYLQRRTSDMHETAQKGWNAKHEKPDVQKNRRRGGSHADEKLGQRGKSARVWAG
jgi:hypothetical protein